MKPWKRELLESDLHWTRKSLDCASSYPPETEAVKKYKKKISRIEKKLKP